MKHASVLIIMGSKSDMPTMKAAMVVLDNFGVAYDVRALSAHRTPDVVAHLLKNASIDGYQVVIAAAGGAAHLAGVCAAHTTLPVIGVPMPSEHLKGMDSLLSTVQMPQGIPVLTTAIGKPGAGNAALGAIAILALSNKGLAADLREFRVNMTEKVVAIDDEIQKGKR